MKHGLNLYGRYTDGGYPAIDQGIEFSFYILFRLAKSALSRRDPAPPPANLTLNILIF
jgi:hypothetical protein